MTLPLLEGTPLLAAVWLMKIKVCRRQTCNLQTCGSLKMYWRDKGSSFWRLVVALAVAAMIFGVPASHASASLCSIQRGATVAHQLDHGSGQAAGKILQGGKWCCGTTCTACLAATTDACLHMRSDFPPRPNIQVSVRLLGLEPMPAFEPPRSAT